MKREHGMNDAAIELLTCPKCGHKFDALITGKPARIYCPSCGHFLGIRVSSGVEIGGEEHAQV